MTGVKINHKIDVDRTTDMYIGSRIVCEELVVLIELLTCTWDQGLFVKS